VVAGVVVATVDGNRGWWTALGVAVAFGVVAMVVFVDQAVRADHKAGRAHPWCSGIASWSIWNPRS
jgi:hypothetical protein